MQVYASECVGVCKCAFVDKSTVHNKKYKFHHITSSSPWLNESLPVLLAAISVSG